MRLFLAVDVNDAVRAWAPAARAAVDRHRAVPPGALKWVAPEQVHLTVRFVGEMEDARAARIVEACAAGVPVPSFDVTLGRVHWLPPAGRPRVLVVAVNDGAAALSRLRCEVDALLARAAGIVAEDRAFLAHVTLARVRDAAGGLSRAGRAVVAACGEPPAGAIPVTALVVYGSELSPHGPRYTALVRAPLTGVS